jgi:hypothetical protein
MTATASDWYPSCVVKLTLRFDESLHVGKPKDEISFDAQAAQTQESRILGRTATPGADDERFGNPVLNTGGQHRPRRLLDEVRQRQNVALSVLDHRALTDNVTPGSAPVASKAAGGLPTAEVEPLTFGTDSFTVICNRVPKKGTFTLPHPRQAPTFQLTFDYTEFPIDPQLVRAVGVEIHLGSVSADDFARGMRGEIDQDGRPLSILKTTDDIVDPFTGRKQVNQGTLLFYATADTWKVSHTDKGSQIILEGREIRAILIDTKIVPSQVEKINLSQEIGDVVADLLRSIRFEHSFRLMVAMDATEWPNGKIPSPGDAGGLTAVRQKAESRAGAKVKDAHGSEAGVETGAKAAMRSTPENGTKGSYWDLITNYCELVGGMPHLVGSILWIRPVHRIFDIVDPSSKIPTPFAGGQPRRTSEEQIRVRRLVLGRDIRQLDTERKFGGVAIVPTVQTISFDDRGTGRQRLIFGQWPPAGSDAADAKAESDLLRVPMWGVRSLEQLTQIARGIYEEIGRGETGGQAITNNLASFGGDNMDPDILRLRPLEPVEFVVDSSTVRAALPVTSDVNELARLSFSQEVDRLTERLGDRAVARALVALARGAVREVLRYYQVVGVTFEWDKGVKTSMTFQNYIVPRNKAADVSDRRSPKDVTTKPVKVPGQGRKAKASVKVTISDMQRLPTSPTSTTPRGRPRTLADSLLTPRDRGRRGLQ